MMAGNYMGDFFGFSYFSQKQTVQFENPAVQTYSRLRRIFWPEQNFPEHLLEKVPVVHGRGPMAVDDSILWKIMKFWIWR